MDNDIEQSVNVLSEDKKSEVELQDANESKDDYNETKKVSENQKYFYTEVMSTAGPRKNFNEDAHEGDYDLGEDVVGCFTRKNKTYFWLLDGTSDSPIYKTTEGNELFSSRLLAQEVAWHIQKILWADNNEELSSKDILKESFQIIQKDWEEKFNKLSENDNQTLLDILKDKKQMIISTTIIFGVIDIEGNLNVSQIGDSYIITNPAQEFPKNTGRLFVFAFIMEENGLIKIESNSFEDTRCQYFKSENVKSLIVASDGISENTIKWLNNIPFDFREEGIRKTVSAIKHKTCDDKAMCIIQICQDV